MDGFLKVGLITKPQGIKGEVKVNPLTDDLTRFNGLKEVYIDGVKHKVIRARIGAGYVILALSGIPDRNVAETLRGKFLCVDRANAVELEEGRYFIVDVEGCTVLTDVGKKIGVITEITSARTDIITVKTDDNKVLRFPFLKDLVVSVDVDNKTFTVNEKRFLEVSCYED